MTYSTPRQGSKHLPSQGWFFLLSPLATWDDAAQIHCPLVHLSHPPHVHPHQFWSPLPQARGVRGQELHVGVQVPENSKQGHASSRLPRV